LKKNALHVALFSLIFPISLYAIGLGEMTIESSLDQPFLAEIELIDVGSAPIVDIKVGIADPEHFERVGYEPIAALSLLNFKIEKNEKGRVVIKVRSIERMTEPYMELVVDLTWPAGQLYKAYTVLLDPPGYQLVSTRAQSSPTYYTKGSAEKTEPGVINKNVISAVEHNAVNLKVNKKATSYGPTITNENVWQIAQRYKTAATILPQVVLAIVGANPDAFKDGNLNGLKVGVSLNIPSSQEIAQVPAELATQEVMAHDNAWNEKTAINHVLTPPYINTQTISLEPVLMGNGSNNSSEINSSETNRSEIPAIPKFNLEAVLPPSGTMPQFILAPVPIFASNSNKQQSLQNSKSVTPEQNASIKAEISVTSAAVDSVRESNAILVEQLHLLQEQNKKLQSQLDKRDKEMALIQSQLIIVMKERKALASQANSQLLNNHSSNLWPLFFLFILAAGGGGFAYWYFKIRERDSTEDPYLVRAPIEPTFKEEPVKENLDAIKSELVEPGIEFDQEAKQDHSEQSKFVDDSSSNGSLEFESGLHQLIPEKGTKGGKNTKEDNSDEQDQGLDFVSPLSMEQSLIKDDKLEAVIKPKKNQSKNKAEKEVTHIMQIESLDLKKTTESESKNIEIDPEITQFFAEQEPEKNIADSTISNEVSDDEHNATILMDSNELTPPLKSNAALDTLLALAKTYIGMDDLDSARFSLEEVMKYGNDSQKLEAKQLLDELKGK
jgi:FimV-like protein